MPDQIISQPSAAEKPSDSLQRIATAKPIIQKLVSDWSPIEKMVDENRKMRKMRVNIDELKESGKIGASDTYIGVRTIDNNIAKDIPPYIAYIKQSRRLAVFEPQDMRLPRDLAEQLEAEFTRVLTYPEWEFDYIRWIDGSELHGFEWLSVVYDDSKPGHCAVNHVSMHDLIFDAGVEDIQHARLVVHRFRPTLVTLKELAAKHQFNPKALKEIEQKVRDKQASGTAAPADQCPLFLYKVYFKEGGLVYCGWYAPDYCDEWLKDPYPFWNGIKTAQQTVDIDPATGQPVPTTTWNNEYERDYPFYVLIYKVTEDRVLVESQGRGEMDLYIQEAGCGLWSSFINRCRASANIIWAPKTPNPDQGGTAPKQLDLVIGNNRLWDRPMEQLVINGPDSMLPKALEMLSTQNADNINQPAWTVNNREDSRKTATEVKAAAQAQTLLNTVSVVMFSVGMRKVLNAAWRIVQSCAMQNLIMFLPDEQGRNQLEVISQNFTVKAAGDTDVIERQELEMKMQQDWPVIQATPIAGLFLEEYLRLRYPMQAERYVAQLRAGDPKKAVISSLGTLLQQAVTDESGGLRPEWQQFAPQLQQAQQAAQQALAMP